MNEDGYSIVQITIDPNKLRKEFSLQDDFSGIILVEPTKNLYLAGVRLNISCSVSRNNPDDSFNGSMTTFGSNNYEEIVRNCNIFTKTDHYYDDLYHHLGAGSFDKPPKHSENFYYIPIHIKKQNNEKKMYSEYYMSTKRPIEVFGYSFYSGVFPFVDISPIILPPDDSSLSLQCIETYGSVTTTLSAKFIKGTIQDTCRDLVQAESFFHDHGSRFINEKTSSKWLRKLTKQPRTDREYQPPRGVLLNIQVQSDINIIKSGIVKSGEIIPHLNFVFSTQIDPSNVSQDFQSTMEAELTVTNIKIELESYAYITRGSNNFSLIRDRVLYDRPKNIVLDMEKFTRSGNLFERTIDLVENDPMQIPDDLIPNISSLGLVKSQTLRITVSIKDSYAGWKYDFRRGLMVEDKEGSYSAKQELDQPPSYSEN